MVKYLKGIIGIALIFIGIGMMFFDETEFASYFILGFGIGLTGSEKWNK